MTPLTPASAALKCASATERARDGIAIEKHVLQLIDSHGHQVAMQEALEAVQRAFRTRAVPGVWA